MDLFDICFGVYDRPKWREEFELKLYRLEKRTGLSKEQLRRVADAIHEEQIIKL